jgi:hypothetical protein
MDSYVSSKPLAIFRQEGTDDRTSGRGACGLVPLDGLGHDGPSARRMNVDRVLFGLPSFRHRTNESRLGPPPVGGPPQAPHEAIG